MSVDNGMDLGGGPSAEFGAEFAQGSVSVDQVIAESVHHSAGSEAETGAWDRIKSFGRRVLNHIPGASGGSNDTPDPGFDKKRYSRSANSASSPFSTLENGESLLNREEQFVKLNDSIDSLVASRAMPTESIDLGEEGRLAEDCIYYAMKYAEASGLDHAGQVLTVLAVNAGLDRDNAVNVLKLGQVDTSENAMTAQSLHIFLTEDDRLEASRGQYDDRISRVMQEHREAPRSAEQLIPPTIPVGSEFSDLVSSDTDPEMPGGEFKRLDQEFADDLTSEDSDLDRDFDQFMNGQPATRPDVDDPGTDSSVDPESVTERERPKGGRRSAWFIGVTAVSALALAASYLGIQSVGSSPDQEPKSEAAGQDSQASTSTLETTSTVPSTTIDSTTTTTVVSLGQEFGVLDTPTEVTPTPEELEQAIEAQVLPESEMIELFEIKVGDKLWNQVQDWIVGQHGAAADNNLEVGQATIKILDSIASSNGLTRDQLSQFDPGDTYTLYSETRNLIEATRVALMGKL